MELPKESIFSSSLRSFCKAIAIVLGLFITVLPISFMIMLLSADYDVGKKTTLNFLPNAEGKTEFLSERSPVVLHVNIQGVIGKDHLTAQDVKHQLVESRTGLLKSDRVKAILLNINSPGGKVGDSDAIYRQIMQYKKKYNVPVYAYVEELCASGGMYIACAADKIYSSPTGIIGSIGVVLGPFFNVSDTISRWGIESKTLTAGKNKDMMNPFRQWKENEDSSLKTLISFFYDQFVSIVVASRPQVQQEMLREEYGAQIFDGPRAKTIGLIDVDNSSYKETLNALVKEANIDQAYQVIELLPKRKWLNLLSAMNKNVSNLCSLLHRFFSSSADENMTPFSYKYDPETNLH